MLSQHTPEHNAGRSGEWGDQISELHRYTLEVESGIAPEIVTHRGYRTVTQKTELERLGFKRSQRLTPGLLIPVYGVAGQVDTYQLRPDKPRILQGKALKYETPAGSAMAIDVHPDHRSKLFDPRIPLFITEGVKKGDALGSRGEVCISLLGVWNWRGTNDLGGKTILPAWESVALNGRMVLLTFDSDVMEKDPVWLALNRLGSWAESRGAKVYVLQIPAQPGGPKIGIDDFLVQGGDLQDLKRKARPLSDFANDRPSGNYKVVDGSLHYAPAGTNTDQRLCNFEAKIVTEIEHDDGQDRTHTFELEGTLRGKTFRIELTPDELSATNWVIPKLGASAIVLPGSNVRDHIRTAIQTRSGEIPRKRVFTHTGWTEIDGERKFLSASGAIGADGLDRSVTVSLEDRLQLYSLPDPPTGDDRTIAIHASMRMLEIDAAPIEVMAPQWAAVYRAPLGRHTFSVFVVGQTGSMKSQMQALAVQHFGAEMVGDMLPANWTSTVNYNESLAFSAKDVLFAIDDFKPVGSDADVNRMHRDADRLFRSAANNAGRGRMRSDTSLRNARVSRALICASGEDIPKGESVRARLFIVEVTKRNHAGRWSILDQRQADAKGGLYAQSLAAYVQWLAGHPEAFGRFEHLKAELEVRASSKNDHKRTAEQVADLAAAAAIFGDFAVDCEALTRSEADKFWEQIWDALTCAARKQSDLQAQSEPTQQYREYLISALRAGVAHLANPANQTPDNPGSVGWRRVRGSDWDPVWAPLGLCIGWISGNELWIEPKAAFGVVQEFARKQGDSLPITVGRLNKSLDERGLLLATDTKRETKTMRRMVAGESTNVLVFPLGFIGADTGESDKPDKPDISSKNPSNHAGSVMSGFCSGTISGSSESDKPDIPNDSGNDRHDLGKHSEVDPCAA